MLKLKDIEKIDKIDSSVVRFFVELASERLRDMLDTKKQLEQKIFFLLRGYIIGAVAMFGLANTICELEAYLNCAALFFVLGIGTLLYTLIPSEYGNIGRHSKDWLHDYTYLKTKKEEMGHIYAYVLHSYTHKIDASRKSNLRKVFCLKIAILFGAASICPFILRIATSLI